MTNILLLANKKFVTNRNELMYDQAVRKWFRKSRWISPLEDMGFKVSFQGFQPMTDRFAILASQTPVVQDIEE